MNTPPQHPTAGWGPQHQSQGNGRRTVVWTLVISVFLMLGGLGLSPLLAGVMTATGFAVLVVIVAVRNEIAAEQLPAGRIAACADPFWAVLGEGEAHGGGVYLGADRQGGWRFARPERAVLVLGPPRSGKTSAVMVPALLAHAGPAVSASTKPDVMDATVTARSRLAGVWVFDPTGTARAGGGRVLRWSPVTTSGSWDGALLMARAMVTATSVGAGTSDQTHWSRRAQALLAPLLHAAATGGQGIDRVAGWVLRHELDEPAGLLKDAGAELACGVLVGLRNTEARERSSIFSAAADALDAYSSQGALNAASDPNFDADAFVRSGDTIYIHAPAEHQALAAPLICGLLSEIRAAAYRAPRGPGSARVLFALDEAANVAPLAELPAIAAEGGGQGLTLLAAFQDLSQARARWGPAADGFLTLFGAKLILPGIGDPQTLEAVSVALGEYDREIVSMTNGTVPFSRWVQPTRTVSSQRQRVLSPGEVANIPSGHALYLDGLAWELLTLTPAHRSEPWRTITQTGETAVVR